MISLLQKMITFGRFTVKQSDRELVVMQKNFLAIIVNILIIVIFFVVFYLNYKRYGLDSIIPNSPKDFLGAVFIPIIFYIILRNIIVLSKGHTLKIDYVLREVWYDSVRIPLDKVNSFIINREVSLKSYYYNIVAVYFSDDDIDEDVDRQDGVNDLIFLPTKFSKLFLIDIANEANKLLIDKKYFIERKVDSLEIGNILIYAIFSSIIVYVLCFIIIKTLSYYF